MCTWMYVYVYACTCNKVLLNNIFHVCIIPYKYKDYICIYIYIYINLNKKKGSVQNINLSRIHFDIKN